MGLSQKQKAVIENIIAESLRAKFTAYKPQAVSMPFHAGLLGKDRLALYSFIRSIMNAAFQASIFEPVAVELAKGNFIHTARQKNPGAHISAGAQREITEIMNGITTAATEPQAAQEIARIRKVCRTGEANTVKLRNTDIWLEGKAGEIVMIEMKTPKPNISGFEDHKRQLLSWIAAVLYQNPKAQVTAMIAMPYNPHAPKPYKWWTLRGMLDLEAELKVAEGFWNFLAGGDVYDDLLGCFENVGIMLRGEIDNYFAQFEKNIKR